MAGLTLWPRLFSLAQIVFKWLHFVKLSAPLIALVSGWTGQRLLSQATLVLIHYVCVCVCVSMPYASLRMYLFVTLGTCASLNTERMFKWFRLWVLWLVCVCVRVPFRDCFKHSARLSSTSEVTQPGSWWWWWWWCSLQSTWCQHHLPHVTNNNRLSTIRWRHVEF